MSNRRSVNPIKGKLARPPSQLPRRCVQPKRNNSSPPNRMQELFSRCGATRETTLQLASRYTRASLRLCSLPHCKHKFKSLSRLVWLSLKKPSPFSRTNQNCYPRLDIAKKISLQLFRLEVILLATRWVWGEEGSSGPQTVLDMEGESTSHLPARRESSARCTRSNLRAVEVSDSFGRAIRYNG